MCRRMPRYDWYDVDGCKIGAAGNAGESLVPFQVVCPHLAGSRAVDASEKGKDAGQVMEGGETAKS